MDIFLGEFLAQRIPFGGTQRITILCGCAWVCPSEISSPISIIKTGIQTQVKVDGELCTLSLAKQIADIEGIIYSAGEDGDEDSTNVFHFGSCKGTGCVCATANARFKMWGCLVLFIVLFAAFCSERVLCLQISSRYESCNTVQRPWKPSSVAASQNSDWVGRQAFKS